MVAVAGAAAVITHGRRPRRAADSVQAHRTGWTACIAAAGVSHGAALVAAHGLIAGATSVSRIGIGLVHTMLIAITASVPQVQRVRNSTKLGTALERPAVAPYAEVVSSAAGLLRIGGSRDGGRTVDNTYASNKQRCCRRAAIKKGCRAVTQTIAAARLAIGPGVVRGRDSIAEG